MASKLRKTVRVVGGGHSPSDIVCTEGYMISLKNLKAVLEVRMVHYLLTCVLRHCIVCSNLAEVPVTRALEIAIDIQCKLKSYLFNRFSVNDKASFGKRASINKGLPGGVLVSLFPFKIALCSHVPTLSDCFRTVIFRILFPLFPKIG